MRNEKIHFACATDEELSYCWSGFYGAEHPESQGNCERCEIPLLETPDP